METPSKPVRLKPDYKFIVIVLFMTLNAWLISNGHQALQGDVLQMERAQIVRCTGGLK